MRAALGVLVIAVVIVTAFLVLAAFGLFGAAMVGPIVPKSVDLRGTHWVPIALATGLVAGQAAAMLAFVGAAWIGLSVEGIVPVFCLSASALGSPASTQETARHCRSPWVRTLDHVRVHRSNVGAQSVVRARPHSPKRRLWRLGPGQNSMEYRCLRTSDN